MQRTNSYVSRIGRFAFPIALAVLLLAIYWILTMPTEDKGAAWRNIAIGESTPADIITELGTPDKVEQRLLRTIYYYYPEGGRVGRYDTPRIVVQGGVVVQIEDNTARHSESIYLSQFIQEYEVPDYVTWAHEAVGDRVVVFLDDGVLLLTGPIGIQPETTLVVQVYFFRPCSMICVRLKFPILVFGRARARSEENGASSIFNLEDPWGLTKDQ